MATFIALLRLLLANLAHVWDTLWQAFLEWQEQRKQQASSAPAKRRRRQKAAVPAATAAATVAAPAAQAHAADKSAVKPTPGAPSQFAGGSAATLPTCAAPPPASKPSAKPPPAAASDSSSSSEDECEAPAASTLPASWASLAGAAPQSDAGAWEPVRSKKPARPAAGSASGAGGRAGAAPPLNQHQKKRGTLRTCDRPGCGAQGRGFRKCGSCGTVHYCTPACQGSDWERHEPQCV
ncbi:hypothetical protein D9Q98_000056 [Chlorella vulgaris]|uniref:MYND-type domain-containing protein n=1 Tax=Chlorella vulgaris TaxID=3077 RepID=A0A9D4Z172_CHLVU|nr:hypothetical protein D9Q98_000056 [Chlorella vulgaris]